MDEIYGRLWAELEKEDEERNYYNFSAERHWEMWRSTISPERPTPSSKHPRERLSSEIYGEHLLLV